MFNISILVGEASTAGSFNTFSTVEDIPIVTFTSFYIREWAAGSCVGVKAGVGAGRHAAFVVRVSWAGHCRCVRETLSPVASWCVSLRCAKVSNSGQITGEGVGVSCSSAEIKHAVVGKLLQVQVGQAIAEGSVAGDDGTTEMFSSPLCSLVSRAWVGCCWWGITTCTKNVRLAKVIDIQDGVVSSDKFVQFMSIVVSTKSLNLGKVSVWDGYLDLESVVTNGDSSESNDDLSVTRCNGSHVVMVISQDNCVTKGIIQSNGDLRFSFQDSMHFTIQGMDDVYSSTFQP